jgi:hypothetical protein
LTAPDGNARDRSGMKRRTPALKVAIRRTVISPALPVCATVLCVALLATALTPSTSQAAEITQVADAFEDGNPWDGIFGLRFVHTQRRALILREWICQANDGLGGSGNNPLCPTGNAVVDTRQLAFSETMNVLNIDGRIGLWHDFEFYFTLPIVVGWKSELTYDEGVSAGNSLVDSPLTSSLFGVPNSSGNRVGFGDMILGLKIAPLHGDRDAAYPSWVLGVEYMAPTGSARTAGETSVGSAVHALTLSTAISRKLGRFDPYLKLHGVLRFADPKGPFKNERVTQTLVAPGHSIGVLIGTEIYPWHEPSKDGSYVSIDLRASADFTFEGREFTELFDALGTSDCDPATQCNRTTLTRGELDRDTGRARKTNGVTDVEQYGRFGAGVGMTYQPMHYIKVKLAFDYWHTTSHYLTFAAAGKDLDGENGVEQNNSDGLNEYNPFYNESVDGPGARFRVDDKNTYQLMISIEGQI